ncbi:VWA domain-containing protein [Chloroflexota bacterium]
MTFIEALASGYVNNLDEFYYLARAMLVKSESYFDHYDVAFQEYFRGIEVPAEILEQVLEWLKDPFDREFLDEAEKEALKEALGGQSFDELLKQLEERLNEQTEQHDGGDKWIGRGGRSPFGHSGMHPRGIRIGGESRGGGAIQIAQERRYRNYRSDLVLDIRQMKMALRGLRQLNRVGVEDELDLEKTIKVCAENAGDIELMWRRSRKHVVKVLLLMDVGGSMDPYAELCSQLFTAAHSSSHFKDFQYYYFHNCVYDQLYRDMEMRKEAISTEDLLRNIDPEYKLLIVGDAMMGLWELTEKYGAIYYFERNEIPGIVRLKSLANHFAHRIWLNPVEDRFWINNSIQMIGKMFPMYPLTIDGLTEAMRKLIVAK